MSGSESGRAGEEARREVVDRASSPSTGAHYDAMLRLPTRSLCAAAEA
jgi:hypothetical protein